MYTNLTLLALADAGLCSGSPLPRSATVRRRRALLWFATNKAVLSVQGADESPNRSTTTWTSPGTRAGRRRRQPATPAPTPTNPAPALHEAEAESIILLFGLRRLRVAVSGLRRGNCRSVLTLCLKNNKVRILTLDYLKSWTGGDSFGLVGSKVAARRDGAVADGG